jgi:hypothetical protein
VSHVASSQFFFFILSFIPSTIMSDGSSDVSTQWNNLLATIDITLRTTRSETGQSDSSNVSAQWNSLLANIDTPGVVAQTEAKDIPETTSDVSLSTSPQPTQNSSEDEYHPSPVPSPVLFNQTGPSSSEDENGDVQHAVGE